MAGVFAVLLLASGCDKKPTGQIVAVVNGEEISLQELNAELDGVNLPPNADKKLVMKQLLQQVIDRRLLAQSAKEEGLDRDPSYITRQRKMSEELLVSMYAKKTADTIRVPDAAAIDKYIASHPTMFAQRTRYKVDQLQFDMPQDVSQLKKLEGDHSLEAVATSLTAMGIKFQRGAGAIDSGAVPPETLKQITALPAGEPFIIPANGKVVVSVITASEPLLVPAEQSKPMAVQAIRNESLGNLGRTRLKDARTKAKIEYQPDYEPAPAKPAAPAAAAK